MTLAEAQPTGAIAALGAAMLAAYLSAVSLFPKPDGRIIVGDAVQQYVQLRSVVLDRDLDFRNDYALMYRLDLDSPDGRAWVEDRRTPTGAVRTLMPVGPALLWAPLFLMAAAALTLGGGAPLTGTEWLLQIAPGMTGIAAASAAAGLAFQLARKFSGQASAIWATAGIWIGSHALYYSLVSPTYSHAASMLAVTLLLWHWITRRAVWTLGTAAVSGALVGVAALMRWQDALLIVIPAIASLRGAGPLPKRLAGAAAAGICALIVFSPQMIVWQALYGQPLAIPQGGSFIEWWAPNPVAVLFSDNHGLFTWSPILIPACLGLVHLVRRHRDLALPVALVALSTWYVNAAVTDWWAGEAYGARRFLSLFPLFVVGLAVWLDRSAHWWRRGVVVALVGANVLLLLQYQLFMKGLRDLAPYPRGIVDLWLVRFVVPFRLLGRWLW